MIKTHKQTFFPFFSFNLSLQAGAEWTLIQIYDGLPFVVFAFFFSPKEDISKSQQTQ